MKNGTNQHKTMSLILKNAKFERQKLFLDFCWLLIET